MSESEQVAQQMQFLAKAFVETIGQDVATIWDYSAQSIAPLEQMIGGFHDEGNRSGSMENTIAVAGAYLGEVMVRQLGATWADGSQQPESSPFYGIHPLLLLGKVTTSPHAKVAKRLDNGPEDNLVSFYRVIAREWSGDLPPKQQPGGASTKSGGFLSRLLGRKNETGA